MKYKLLKDYKDKELISLLALSDTIAIDKNRLAQICAEILRRMNEIKPLLED